jgi:hypothetical protein
MKKINLLFFFLVFILLGSPQVPSAFAGFATISWDPPVTNADGTPVNDLAGYKIYYGTSPGNYSQNIDVGNVTTYTVTNLPEGITYYFVATAYDIARNESADSNEISKTIQVSQQYTLSVAKAGTGSGTVTSSPAGITCGSACSRTYDAGTSISLSASPAANSIFAGWSTGCSGAGTCIVTMDAAKTISSTFTLKTYAITASAEVGGSISPSGSVPVNYGGSKTFTITPNTGYHVTSVVVDGSSVGAVQSYTFSNVTSNHTIGATFAADNSSQETIIDNRDAATSHTGTWSTSNGSNSYGVDSVFGRNGSTFTWYFTPPQSGNYEISIWWTYRDSRSTSVPVDIEYPGGTDRIFINQKQTLSDWYVLGTYAFQAGVSYKVTITAQPIPTSDSTTCADAVLFSFISSTIPPAAYIDSITPKLAEPGQIIEFRGHGDDSDGYIEAYQWESSIDGFLSDSQTFTTALSKGTHVISLHVQDNEGVWSRPVTEVLAVGTPPMEVIIDNRDKATSQTGTWNVSGKTNPYGPDSLWSRDGTTFTWHFTPPQSGSYEMSMWWTFAKSRSTNIPVDIEHSSGTTRVYVNEQKNAGKWNILGTYYFEGGTKYRITVTSRPGPTSTCADAVRFVYVQ